MGSFIAVVTFLILQSAMFANIFDYDLCLSKFPGKSKRVLVVLHGYGQSHRQAEQLKKLGVVDAAIVGFNFPDYDLEKRNIRAQDMTFGTVKEILPPLFVLKQCIIDEKCPLVDLYGYSAGGGAVINVLAALSTSLHDEALEKIGIGKREKAQILDTLQRGYILLDTPLKSVEEIIDHRGKEDILERIAAKYRTNNLRPVDSLKCLSGQAFNILVHFQKHDEVLSNRDDQLYIDCLSKANALGKTWVVIDDDGGHMKPHFSLWKAYADLLDASSKSCTKSL